MGTINDLLKPDRKRHGEIKSVFYKNKIWEGEGRVCEALNEHLATIGKRINDSFNQQDTE